MERSKFIYGTDYGTTADIYLLPTGTKFSVENGGWIGEIIEEDGKRFMLVVNTGRKIKLTESIDYGLVISIRGNGTQEQLRTQVESSATTNQILDQMNNEINCLNENVKSYEKALNKMASHMPGMIESKTFDYEKGYYQLLEMVQNVLQSQKTAEMHYYEIVFYGEGHEKDWSFYIKSTGSLTYEEVAAKLQNEFLGVDGLEQHHIDNIDMIHEITKEEFTDSCGIEG